MAVIVPFNADRRRRSPKAPGEARGEIVIFSGVRIERTISDTPPPRPPVKTQAQPAPGRGF